MLVGNCRSWPANNRRTTDRRQICSGRCRLRRTRLTWQARFARQSRRLTNPDVQRATVFANALRNAPGTIKKSGISAPFQSVEEIFASNPQGMQGIRNVEESLMREARTNAMFTNQNIAPRLKGPVERMEKPVPPLLRSGVSAARGIAKAITRQSEPRIQQIIDDALVNPQAFAELLSRLPPTERSAILNQNQGSGSEPEHRGAHHRPGCWSIQER